MDNATRYSLDTLILLQEKGIANVLCVQGRIKHYTKRALHRKKYD
jgi:hypothetical protein